MSISKIGIINGILVYQDTELNSNDIYMYSIIEKLFKS